MGQPITWEQDGEQYVPVISGWGVAVPLWGGEVEKSELTEPRWHIVDVPPATSIGKQ